MPYFATDKEEYPSEVISDTNTMENNSVITEKISNNKEKKILLSKRNLKTKDITYDSGTGYIPNNNSTQPQTNSYLRDLSVESIGNRIKNQISTPVFAKIKMLAQNSYEKIKFYADTIFKAKSQVMSRLLNNPNWLYRQEFQEATRFESNIFLADGLEKSLLKLAEIMYKSDTKINSEERLSYVYLRNGLANSTKKYLLDNFEFSDDERYQITQALAFQEVDFMEKKDVYAYTPTVNIEKYEKLDSEERKDYLSLDKRMHRITEGFAYDVGKVLKDAQEKFRNQGRKDIFSFTDWLKSWGFAKSRAYQLINFTEYVDKLQNNTELDGQSMVETFNSLPKMMQYSIVKDRDPDHQNQVEKLLSEKVTETEQYKKVLQDFYNAKDALDVSQAKQKELEAANRELQIKNIAVQEENAKTQSKLIESQQKIHKLQTENYKLQNQPVEQIQVPPADYGEIKRLNKKLIQDLEKS